MKKAKVISNVIADEYKPDLNYLLAELFEFMGRIALSKSKYSDEAWALASHIIRYRKLD